MALPGKYWSQVLLQASCLGCTGSKPGLPRPRLRLWQRQEKVQQPAAADKAKPDTCPKYLRVVEKKDKSISLEIASRNFVRADGSGRKLGRGRRSHW